MKIQRSLATLAIVVAGACTTAMNWRFSYQLGANEWDSYTWAIFSVALDLTKWLMLPCAALVWTTHKLRSLAAIMIWFMATIYSFTAALGFAALNRDAAIGARQQQAELHATIELMKRSPLWQSSAACADATSRQSKEFCAHYRGAAARLQSPRQEVDPQSTLLAQLSGLQLETVRLALALFLAAACEVISALGFFAIMPSTVGSPTTEPKVWKAPP